MNRSMVLSLLTSVLVALGLLLPASAVQAGSNGQQLQIIVSCQYAPVMAMVKVEGYNQNKVEGYNQNGEKVTWTASPNSKKTTTYKWWWVGQVFVTYKFAGTNPETEAPFEEYGASVYVPKQHPKNIYYLIVDSGMDCQQH